jgi:hypothetical protein
MTGSVLVFWCRAMLRCEMCAWQYGERRNAWFARRGAKIYARQCRGSQNVCFAMRGQALPVRGDAHPSDGNTHPPSGHIHSPGGGTHIHQAESRMQPRAPTASLPWLVIPTLYRENPASFGDRRHTTEERRASARRGCSWASVIRDVLETHLQARYTNQGWLTPAAPGCMAFVRCEMRNLRCTVEHGTRAAGVSPPWVCKPRVQRQRQRGEFPRFELACRVHSTGGMRSTGSLRPPLLCCGAKVCRRKTIFAMHIRTPGKSGGREPAVGSVETRLPCTANDVQRLTTAEPRAAGVSPPWVW